MRGWRSAGTASRRAGRSSFGQGYTRIRKFREVFHAAVVQVLLCYPGAKVRPDLAPQSPAGGQAGGPLWISLVDKPSHPRLLWGTNR